MRNNIYYSILALIFYGCGNNIKSNLEIRNQIDSLKIKSVLYEFEVDSIGRIIDTISIEKNKINEIGFVVYKEKTTLSNHGNLTSINYYKDNENLFFQKYESAELGILSTSEFWEENNLIIKGIYKSYQNNKINEVIELDYDHFFNDNGKRLKTRISSNFKDKKNTGNITERNYDDAERIISEIYKQNGDTINEIDYSYSKSELRNKTIIDYNSSTLTNFIYDEKGYIKGEEVFKANSDSLLKVKEAYYETNNKGQIIMRIEIDLPSKEKKYFKFRKDLKKPLKQIKA